MIKYLAESLKALKKKTYLGSYAFDILKLKIAIAYAQSGVAGSVPTFGFVGTQGHNIAPVAPITGMSSLKHTTKHSNSTEIEYSTGTQQEGMIRGPFFAWHRDAWFPTHHKKIPRSEPIAPQQFRTRHRWSCLDSTAAGASKKLSRRVLSSTTKKH